MKREYRRFLIFLILFTLFFLLLLHWRSRRGGQPETIKPPNRPPVYRATPTP